MPIYIYICICIYIYTYECICPRRQRSTNSAAKTPKLRSKTWEPKGHALETSCACCRSPNLGSGYGLYCLRARKVRGFEFWATFKELWVNFNQLWATFNQLCATFNEAWAQKSQPRLCRGFVLCFLCKS